MSAKTEKVKQKKAKEDKIVFKVTGSYKKGRRIQRFTKEIISVNKQKAEDYIYSILGSKHRVKRREITIDSIDKIPVEEITDTIIKHMVEG